MTKERIEELRKFIKGDDPTSHYRYTEHCDCRACRCVTDLLALLDEADAARPLLEAVEKPDKIKYQDASGLYREWISQEGERAILAAALAYRAAQSASKEEK